MMRWLSILFVLVTIWPIGCGSQGEKGANKDKDKPVPAEKK